MRELNSGFLITFPLECSPPGFPAGSFRESRVWLAAAGRVSARKWGTDVRMKLISKSPREIEVMRAAGKIVWLTLNELEAAARPGVSTGDLDALAERII